MPLRLWPRSAPGKDTPPFPRLLTTEHGEDGAQRRGVTDATPNSPRNSLTGSRIWFALIAHEVVRAGQLDEVRATDVLGQVAALFDAAVVIATSVHDERGHPHCRVGRPEHRSRSSSR
jgi:hypothetical protein